MFAADFADPAAYEIPEQVILDEADNSSRVIWRMPGAANPPLYPNGTADLLREAR